MQLLLCYNSDGLQNADIINVIRDQPMIRTITSRQEEVKRQLSETIGNNAKRAPVSLHVFVGRLSYDPRQVAADAAFMWYISTSQQSIAPPSSQEFLPASVSRWRPLNLGRREVLRWRCGTYDFGLHDANNLVRLWIVELESAVRCGWSAAMLAVTACASKLDRRLLECCEYYNSCEGCDETESLGRQSATSKRELYNCCRVTGFGT